MSLGCVDHPWYTFKKPRINHWLQRSWREQDWRNKQSAQTNKLTNKLTNPKQNKKTKKKKQTNNISKDTTSKQANTMQTPFLSFSGHATNSLTSNFCDAGHMGRWFSSNPWHWLVRHASIMYILYIHTVTVCNSNILSWSFLLVWIALLGGSQTHPLIMRRRRKRRRTCRR